MTEAPRFTSSLLAWNLATGKARVLTQTRKSSITADGTDKRHLVFTMREDGYGDPVNPAWSPDGAEIALDDNRGWIWLVKPDGADAKAILHGDSHVTPAVTADGSTVGSNSEIYVINVDGTRGSSA